MRFGLAQESTPASFPDDWQHGETAVRKDFLAALTLALGTAGLAACSGGGDTTAAAPEGVPGLSITNARMVLPAVKGNPAAVYFDLAYDGDRALSLSRASVKDARSAMMHEYGEYELKVQMMEMLHLPLTKGTKVKFEPGGKHVMAMDVSPTLKPGDTTELTLYVSGGDKTSVPVKVEAPGSEK